MTSLLIITIVKVHSIVWSFHLKSKKIQLSPLNFLFCPPVLLLLLVKYYLIAKTLHTTLSQYSSINIDSHIPENLTSRSILALASKLVASTPRQSFLVIHNDLFQQFVQVYIKDCQDLALQESRGS